MACFTNGITAKQFNYVIHIAIMCIHVQVVTELLVKPMKLSAKTVCMIRKILYLHEVRPLACVSLVRNSWKLKLLKCIRTWAVCMLVQVLIRIIPELQSEL